MCDVLEYGTERLSSNGIDQIIYVKTYPDYVDSKYIPSNRTVDDMHNAIFLDTYFLSLNWNTNVKGEQKVIR